MKKVFSIKKGFATKEVLILLSILLMLALLAVKIYSSMTISIDSAKEAKYLSYVSQMKKRVEGANSLGAFANVTTEDWVCLGIYSGKVGDSCWGDGNVNVKNDNVADNALKAVDVIPLGQVSPYKEKYTKGTTFKINSKNIEMRVYIGDAKKAKQLCSQLGMVQDLENDNLTCVLNSPLEKS